MNDKAGKIVEGKSINSPQRRGWLLEIMSILLLFCVQPLLSAKTPSEPPPKTLLEQYLHCDGIEEFAYYQEYPGRTNQFPNTYWCGSYQGNNFLFLMSYDPIEGIPETLPSSIQLMTSACFETNWWAISSGPLSYTREIWVDKNIPEEEDNGVRGQCNSEIYYFREAILNLGLAHSSEAMMTLDKGKYADRHTQVITYSVTEKTDFGMPRVIRADVLNLEGKNPPIVWRKVIDYTTNPDGQHVPCLITHYGLREGDKEEMLMRRIVITKLIPAKEKLTRSHFLRSGFEDASRFPKIGPSVYYVEGKKMVGYDDKSNKVYRMSPDDPRLLNEPSKRRLLHGYWISSIFITVVAFSFFWFLKKYKQT